MACSKPLYGGALLYAAFCQNMGSCAVLCYGVARGSVAHAFFIPSAVHEEKMTRGHPDLCRQGALFCGLRRVSAAGCFQFIACATSLAFAWLQHVAAQPLKIR